MIFKQMNVSYKCQVTTSTREGYQSPNRTLHPMDSVVICQWTKEEE